jgi:hypothetical protein
MSSRRVPVPAAWTDSRAASVVAVARSTPVYFVQPSPVTVMPSGLASSAPAVSCRVTDSGVPPAASVRAQTEKSYGRPSCRAKPLFQPLLVTPYEPPAGLVRPSSR